MLSLLEHLLLMSNSLLHLRILKPDLLQSVISLLEFNLEAVYITR